MVIKNKSYGYSIDPKNIQKIEAERDDWKRKWHQQKTEIESLRQELAMVKQTAVEYAKKAGEDLEFVDQEPEVEEKQEDIAPLATSKENSEDVLFEENKEEEAPKVRQPKG